MNRMAGTVLARADIVDAANVGRAIACRLSFDDEKSQVWAATILS